MACRHHIYEVVLRKVVELCYPTTVGPDMAVFKRFKHEWEQMDKTQYDTVFTDELLAEALKDDKDELLRFMLNQLVVLLFLQHFYVYFIYFSSFMIMKVFF